MFQLMQNRMNSAATDEAPPGIAAAATDEAPPGIAVASTGSQAPCPDSGRFAPLEPAAILLAVGASLGLGFSLTAALVVGAGVTGLVGLRVQQRARVLRAALAEQVGRDDGRRPEFEAARPFADHVRRLPALFEEHLSRLASSASSQEEAVEETASLVANMRTTIQSISEQVDRLISESDESASSILELGGAIEEVAANTASLHEMVDGSTSSIHEMSASIRQVAAGAEQVQEMAETTAASVTEMDRSVEQVSQNANEAANLTERAHQGARAGHEAVHATIADIEQISSLTTDAMERLSGLVRRISQIGGILSAIDEINDETKLLSLNAAIIAAQAGEQGRAFLVVANHVKTLARRTSASTQDIEKLIGAIGDESTQAVQAMEAGIRAVETGVARSRTAGTALESIQSACSDASARVSEIARATSEQSRNSKGVAEATLKTSEQIQQITTAIAEQRRSSEEMLKTAENALANCLLVHRSTDEQRETSRHITASISEISEMIRNIGIETRVHREAGDAVSEAVHRLLEHAQASGSTVRPMRELVATLEASAAEAFVSEEAVSEGDSARCGD